jgi:hypothetical protein
VGILLEQSSFERKMESEERRRVGAGDERDCAREVRKAHTLKALKTNMLHASKLQRERGEECNNMERGAVAWSMFKRKSCEALTS